MPQKLIQSQEQKLQQVQRLSQQQMLQVRLLEMPLTELEENVNAELDDNPALETASMAGDEAGGDETQNAGDENGGAEQSGEAEADSGEEYGGEDAAVDKEERDDALNDALEGIGRDDQMAAATYDSGDGDRNADYEEMVYGDTTSFYDKLKEQVGETNLDSRQRDIMEYVIGSLDDDGLLRKDDGDISDELAIYHNIDATPDEVACVVKTLQTFDPPGIGAHNLQECLLLQIKRKPKGRMRDLMEKVVEKHFEEFAKKHWGKIAEQLGISSGEAQEVQAELRKLNPKPGSSMGEAEGRNLQQITPDFIVETSDDGQVSFTLNNGNIPDLKVSPSFTELLDTYRNSRSTMNRRDKEALLYAKEKVERAQGFIEAIKQRRRTLSATMQAIIDWQKPFFLDGDEADLRPMILKNIADKTGLDISTISRVSNVKYAQTNWGTFPLRFFFSDGYTTQGGEELSTRKIKLALKELVDSEDKGKPMSDDLLTKEMAKRGFPIARRTVAKYREQLGIPVARLRK